MGGPEGKSHALLLSQLINHGTQVFLFNFTERHKKGLGSKTGIYDLGRRTRGPNADFAIFVYLHTRGD